MILLYTGVCSAQTPEVVLPIEHSREISKLAITKDSRLLVSMDDYDVFIWDLKKLALLRHHKEVFPYDVAVTGTGNKIAIADRKGTTVYDGYNLEKVRFFDKGNFGDKGGLAFSPDGSMIARTGLTGTMIVHHLATGDSVIVRDDYYLDRPLFSLDGKYVLAYSNNYRVIIWDPQTGEKILDDNVSEIGLIASRYQFPIYQSRYAGKMHWVVPVFFKNRTQVFNTPFPNSQTPNNYSFSPGGTVLSGSGTRIAGFDWTYFKKGYRDSAVSYVYLWDYNSGNKLVSKSFGGKISDVVFAGDNDLILAWGKRIVSYHFPGNKIKDILPGKVQVIQSSDLTIDKKVLVCQSADNKLTAFSIPYAKLLISNVPVENAMNFDCDTANRFLIYNNRFRDTLYVINMLTRETFPLVDDSPAHEPGDDIYSAGMSDDGTLAVTGSRAGVITVWDIRTRKIIFKNIERDRQYVDRIDFLRNKNFVQAVKYSRDEIWNIETGKSQPTDSIDLPGKLVGHHFDSVSAYNMENSFIEYNNWINKSVTRWYLFKSGDFLVQLPDNYFYGSREAIRSLKYFINGKLVSFEQFDLQFNRPDKVLQALGCPDTLLIRSYRRAWEKRLSRAGIREDGSPLEFHFPETLLPAGMSTPIVKNDILNLPLQFKDSKYPLKSFNVYVNSVPLFGRKGVRIPGENVHSYAPEIAIPLSDGDNDIEITCINEKGSSSLKEIYKVRHKRASAPDPRIYFLGVGVSKHRQSKYDLDYAAKDIRDLARLFKKRFPDAIIDTLLDFSATRESILALKSRLRSTRPDDIVVMSFSGHGILSQDLDLYLATPDLDFEEPSARGLLYSDLEELLDSIPSRKKLLLLDACHSGEVDKELDDINIVDTLPKNVVRLGSKAFIPKKGYRMSAGGSLELMKELFSEIDKGVGATIISAAGGMEFAYEDPGYSNGIFTYVLKKALTERKGDLDKNGAVTINELKRYVSDLVIKLTLGRQRPTTRSELAGYDWQVW